MYFKRFVIKKYRLMLMVARDTIDTVRRTQEMYATNEQRRSPPIHLPVINTTNPNGTQNRVASKSTTITFRSSRLCHVRRRGLVCIIKHEKILPIADTKKINPNTIASITTRYAGRCSKSLAAFQLLTFMSTLNEKFVPRSVRCQLTPRQQCQGKYVYKVDISSIISTPWVFTLI